MLEVLRCLHGLAQSCNASSTSGLYSSPTHATTGMTSGMTSSTEGMPYSSGTAGMSEAEPPDLKLSSYNPWTPQVGNLDSSNNGCRRSIYMRLPAMLPAHVLIDLAQVDLCLSYAVGA